MRRIAITGSSGYYGRRLIRHIRETDPGIEVLGLDLGSSPGLAAHRFAAVDVRGPELRRALVEFQPDTVVHLAFVVDPRHDTGRTYDININGSRNVLEAVRELRPARLLVASSATAFGPWPDNPLPIDDLAPVRLHPDFQYAREKVVLEELLREFAVQHPQMAVSWVRPCIIYGPNVNNFLSRMLLQNPLVVLPDGCDVPQQFVHEDDVAAATWCILKGNGRGPYNMGPADWISLTDVARETGRRTVKIPLWAMQLASRICWGLRLPLLPYPPGMNLYIRHPWIVAPRRLCQELGFQFQFSTRETLRKLLATHRKGTAERRNSPSHADIPDEHRHAPAA
ncbi:MAG TPA: NAD-dependent epimerase/dehydratase family protein [Planctomycetaceae bacterium]